MHEVESVKVMSIGLNQYTLEGFAKEQDSVRGKAGTGASKELEKCHDSVVSELDRLVDKVNQSTETSPQIDEHAAVRPRMKSMVQKNKD